MYVFNEEGEIERIFGNTKPPKHLKPEMIQKYYKYQSSSRTFTPIVGNKDFSIAVDAVVLSRSFKYK
jgi:Microtubule-binding calmodulin-regulated spectrin-associated